MLKEMFGDEVGASVIMGVDASTKSIAFSIFDESGLLDYGKIDTKSLYEARKSAEGLVKKHGVDLLAIESAVFVNNKSVVIKLAYSFGAICSAADLPNMMVKPMEWLSFIGNDVRSSKDTLAHEKSKRPGMSKAWYNARIRESRKQRTQEILMERFSLEDLNDDDIADAIAVGWFAWEKLNGKA